MKINACFRYFHTCFLCEGETGEQDKLIRFFFSKVNPSTTKSMKRSRRELSIDLAIHKESL